jgi:hypothetical protein
LELKQVSFDAKHAVTIGWLLAIACVPAYFLSILWAKPGIVLNMVAGVAAVLQVYAFVLLIKLLLRNRMAIYTSFSAASRWMFVVVLICAILKLLLQCVSALPYIAAMAYELRPVVIAYLHLFLLGVITLFLFVWYRESGFLRTRYDGPVFALIVVAFAGMEVVLVLMPWWSLADIYLVFSAARYALGFSVALALGFLAIYIRNARHIS